MARTQAGPLGKGWSHNFASSATLGSDGYQGMGEDSALDAVTTLVEQIGRRHLGPPLVRRSTLR
ncbi:hypothetical protein SAMN05216420_101172 [Nitrosospira sp. Nl5]|uniref:hypothetical protein n=1 Tax=Nitrosospira sp. Nl5 TaxID=200120 RepID=UPI00088DD355|nr:hypothetical protein [Nitrosospira sp. Nl5]SCX87276.1 hypothetical protein SAMN05216420_101172 [Nitrosospira sp. Nl5]